MPAEDINRFRLIYFEAARWGDRTEQLQRLASVLSVVEGAPGPIDADLLADLTITVKELRYGTEISGIIARQLDDSLAEGGVELALHGSDALVEEGAAAARELCEPLIVDGKPLPTGQVPQR